MGQLTKIHRFQPYEELKDKSSIFKQHLEEMGSLGYEMLTLIEKELKASSGTIIEESLKLLENNHKDFKSIINDQISLMDTLANRYHDHINEMNKQSITIYYEEKETKVPR
ncbi:hypothetical protein CVD25_14995 [Bacillus canaveralius]|uniref:Uncharacterized protein n=1 Tax=Bacillus canaveralius TaxID=1403243 RepID=A0A2N5GMV8_9BACI|nr:MULTISPECIES: hypothetical protein [Bacillus]PLR82273.1 hypothetical protein CVD23_17330 [Bacillus sp. V33-4]PLR83450.1 hypothetical protein CU635_09140 [Bacillus canaveralius]PLR95369.1 hypothetical protein CVD25_14995 [Bacillus canaveralius]RSK57091.1 hypothetical protein EJA13_01565 [Bacillus canaveralius]